MLQATVDKYARLALAWEEAKLQNPSLTLPDHCAAIGIGVRTLDKALQFYRRRHVELADASKLEAAILSLQERKASLDKRLDRALRGIRVLSKNGDAGIVDASLAGIASLARVILAYDTRILELEGLYKHVVNVQLEGRIEHRHYDLTRLSTDRLIDLRKILIEAATGGRVVHKQDGIGRGSN